MDKSHCILSENKQYALAMSAENLFIAKAGRTYEEGGIQYAEVKTQEVVWSPGLVSWGIKGDKSVFNMNPDCNLCFDNEANQSWCVTTGRDDKIGLLNKCLNAKLTNDGRLVLLDNDGKELWATPAKQ